MNPSSFIKTKSHIFVFLMLLVCSSCAINAQKSGAQNAQSQKDALVGRWQSSEATVEIRSDNTLTINGEEYSYRVKNSVITVSGDEGSMSFPFTFENGKLIVEVEGREVVYTRMKNSSRGAETSNRSGGVVRELVGKWCYMSNLTGTNSRMSNRCFTLYANGTYEYYAETSSSGANGSTASQESDAGRWSATSNSITAYSNTNGKIVYSLEKRNHPRTSDPMLIVDGDAYVTAYRKDPW